ncbi:mycothiol-dependent nitroreductase Rv2466c family protein [Dermabacteraceae bacterium P7074]
MSANATQSECSATQNVDMWFDPSCPWAWMTSRWLKNVTEVRDVQVTFHVMSLGILNEGKELPADYRAHIDETWGGARVALAVEETGGREALDKFYTAYGEAYHVGGNHDRRAVAELAVQAAGVDASVMDVYEGGEIDERLRVSHARSQEIVGGESGTPVVSFDGKRGYFGPVITPAPKGEEAGQLFDGLYALGRVEGFFELKRARHKGPDFS